MYKILSAIMMMLLIGPLRAGAAESADTVGRRLGEVVVMAKANPRDIIPVQTLSGDELERVSGNSVADALRYFSGVQIKDYGGIGGIKTVNIRSMGTNHTGVVYDGVELGNAQNGQIDLGQFSLDNIEALSLYNGQKSDILQPAKDFGTAANIYMRSRRPAFANGKMVNTDVRIRTGSFDLINPSIIFEARLSERVSASVNAEWLNSSGKYKFRYRKYNQSGYLVYDTTAVRQNGDINALRGEINFFGTHPAGSWSAKAYHYNSERGVPGAIVNNVWRRGERIWDNNTFGQGSYSASLGNYSTLNNVKLSHYRTRYINNDEKVVKVDNHYRQSEVYVSTANQYQISVPWSVSVSYDFAWNTMQADLRDFRTPSRFSHYVSLATSLSYPRIKAQGSVLMTSVRDKVKGRQGLKKHTDFSPALIVNGYPFRSRDFSIRAFCKQSFRMPTFNDLYYTDQSNSSLAPERVSQYNIGALYEHSHVGILASVRLSADIYLNRVKDKIVAYPKGMQFRWTMLNLGKVDIRGLDLSGVLSLAPCKGLDVTLRGQYTYQRAIDITDPKDSYHGDQIPYIPHNSASGVANVSYRGWNLNYCFTYVGSRYCQQENIPVNYLTAWNTSDLSLSKDFSISRVKLRVMAEVNNLFDQYYDVILNYPMPGRNFRISAAVGF